MAKEKEEERKEEKRKMVYSLDNFMAIFMSILYILLLTLRCCRLTVNL